MTKDAVKAAMDALHNDFIEVFKKHGPIIQGLGENLAADASFCFAVGFGVALGNHIASTETIPAERKPITASVVMEEAGRHAILHSMTPKQEARQ